MLCTSTEITIKTKRKSVLYTDYFTACIPTKFVSYTTVINPLMPTGAFNICCPRDAVYRTANVEHNGGQKWVDKVPVQLDTATPGDRASWLEPTFSQVQAKLTCPWINFASNNDELLKRHMFSI